jgi:hypothetical protein
MKTDSKNKKQAAKQPKPSKPSVELDTSELSRVYGGRFDIRGTKGVAAL